MCCWGCGSGSKGSYNFNPTARIQFEIQDDGYKSKDYFLKVMREAQQLCAFLCRKFGFGVDKITDHQGAYQAGYGGNHSDIRIWCKQFGITDAVGWFRSEVQKILDEESEDEEMIKELEAKVDALEKRIAELEKPLKIFHYWNQIKQEIPWAYAPLMALYNKGIFSGASASDLNLTYIQARDLVSLAKSMKENGEIDY